ncbi:MAG: VOC family protein, partial [Gemmatimonadetes bacterium]|nr:VOC family protein [Gemmatimonadota bacterium]
MSDERPAVAIGHVRLHTADVAAASTFYQALGMRLCMAWEGMAILELRGGTHLLLIEIADQIQQLLDPVFDLMVDDLDAYKQGLTESGIAASEVTEHAMIHHRRIFVEDPDGHRIAIHSDHTEG